MKAIGAALFDKYSKGARLSASQTIKAKCYDCMGFYADGKSSCGCPDCPCYPYMPYKDVKHDSSLG